MLIDDHRPSICGFETLLHSRFSDQESVSYYWLFEDGSVVMGDFETVNRNCDIKQIEYKPHIELSVGRANAETVKVTDLYNRACSNHQDAALMRFIERQRRIFCSTSNLKWSNELDPNIFEHDDETESAEDSGMKVPDELSSILSKWNTVFDNPEKTVDQRAIDKKAARQSQRTVATKSSKQQSSAKLLSSKKNKKSTGFQ
jgi:hypothetical protein